MVWTSAVLGLNSIIFLINKGLSMPIYKNYRKLAEMFRDASDGSETWKDFSDSVTGTIEEVSDKLGIPEEDVTAVVIDHLENALRDVFGLEQGLESAHEEAKQAEENQ